MESEAQKFGFIDQGNLATVRKLGADVSSVSPSSELVLSDEGLTLETSASNFLTVAKLPYQLSSVINPIFV